MTNHHDPHPLAGKKVQLAAGVTDPIRNLVTAGAVFAVEDWWDRITGKSWVDSPGNIAAFAYGTRIFAIGTVPTDDEVVYGKISSLGHLVHISELGRPL